EASHKSPTEQQEIINSKNSESRCHDHQEIIEQINQLRETVILLESRLSNQSNTHKGLIMKAIISRLKSILRQLEAITPNYYDGLIMQMMGGF
ncbi:MAG: hypothetical protein ACRCU2_00110, partial [Planktothrix sp.]